MESVPTDMPFKQEETTKEDVPVAAPTPVVEKTPLIEPVQNNNLLIGDQAKVLPTSDKDRSIVFEEGVSDLTTEQMSKIDEIIGHFSDLTTNKIAIYSYNVDDGVDVFKKKRISLNRAIEVRSYLIKQGYKNFSIKVININAGSEKQNVVELEEI